MVYKRNMTGMQKGMVLSEKYDRSQILTSWFYEPNVYWILQIETIQLCCPAEQTQDIESLMDQAGEEDPCAWLEDSLS